MLEGKIISNNEESFQGKILTMEKSELSVVRVNNF